MLRRASLDVSETRREEIGSRKRLPPAPASPPNGRDIIGFRKNLLPPPPASLRSGRTALVELELQPPSPSPLPSIFHFFSKSFKFFSHASSPVRSQEKVPWSRGRSASDPSVDYSPLAPAWRLEVEPLNRASSSDGISEMPAAEAPAPSELPELRLSRGASAGNVVTLFSGATRSGASSAPSTPNSLVARAFLGLLSKPPIEEASPASDAELLALKRRELRELLLSPLQPHPPHARIVGPASARVGNNAAKIHAPRPRSHSVSSASHAGVRALGGSSSNLEDLKKHASPPVRWRATQEQTIQLLTLRATGGTRPPSDPPFGCRSPWEPTAYDADLTKDDVPRSSSAAAPARGSFREPPSSFRQRPPYDAPFSSSYDSKASGSPPHSRSPCDGRLGSLAEHEGEGEERVRHGAQAQRCCDAGDVNPEPYTLDHKP